ncbi:TIGR02679 family protein [Streptomyces sp. A3M-1-3]|uniref:TIGR02679 family protein n=1 Tax=Streptomyces sp. A3M-1-3 TaxID=2962044 RepID=UPI0020B73E45|nr:TIGR02679 family protein [Streptomyces sp. A3M-1-3]MCP3818500.1 TIGR02679 family protein [Streptomyces sp. A3M-1-3]
MDLTSATATATVDEGRLRRLLGDPGLAWLVDRARRRLEREQPLTGPVSLSAPTPAQRASAERLLGRSPRSGRSLTVRLDEVDAVLRRSGISPDGLAAAVPVLTGPVLPLGPARQAEDRAWQEAHAPIDALADEIPALAAWAARLRGDGLIRRLAGSPPTAHALLGQVATALRALPADPPASLPAFAARVLGSAHALDDGTPSATVTLSGIRALTGFPDGTGAEWRREAWASAGLLRDELSSTVLTLNLRGTPALDSMAEAGEPAVLTLRQLIRRPPAPSAPTVRICENPAVLAAAADAHGTRSAPLVCLQGQPSAAALTLLRHLHEGGTTLHYHGDFDWGGLRIASALLRRIPWLPWRYTAADYRAAVLTPPAGPPLTGLRAEAPWDPDLPEALAELGVRVEEETVLDVLLSDLSPGH